MQIKTIISSYTIISCDFFIKTFCITINFNYPLKACFLNKKYPITIQTRLTQIVKVYFLLKTDLHKMN